MVPGADTNIVSTTTLGVFFGDACVTLFFFFNVIERSILLLNWSVSVCYLPAVMTVHTLDA